MHRILWFLHHSWHIEMKEPCRNDLSDPVTSEQELQRMRKESDMKLWRIYVGNR